MKTKKELIEFINNSYGMSLNNLNTSFSNINKSKEVWGFNIADSKFNAPVNLLLKNKRETKEVKKMVAAVGVLLLNPVIDLKFV